MSTAAHLEVINKRISAERVMLQQLRSMHARRVTEAPDWEQCINVSWPADGTKPDRSVLLSLLAGKLVHEHRQPLEMAQGNQAIWVRYA